MQIVISDTSVSLQSVITRCIFCIFTYHPDLLSKMKCPKDNSLLEHIPVTIDPGSNMYLDICKKCQGVWLDKSELAPLISYFNTDHEKTYKDWLVATSDGKTTPKNFWNEGERLCPVDGTGMRKHYSGMTDLIGIEQCSTCGGFWFDGSELYAIAQSNEPNERLDAGIAGSISGMDKELRDNYDDRNVFWWDLSIHPQVAIPYIKDLLLNVMVAFLMKK